ncbi:hypothetical protein MKZ38_004381 [Zalerion maritima]|uniref:Uncharacterized protein n=1 Tax=Zalerion maritima TaxID=339359 RepID=A0AAD5RLB8_9PEZI|nr:hypothetical protein MKZ38_004381 [Zalerion maritima]
MTLGAPAPPFALAHQLMRDEPTRRVPGYPRITLDDRNKMWDLLATEFCSDYLDRWQINSAGETALDRGDGGSQAPSGVDLIGLEHQISEERFGRRQTLLWDDTSDLQANSENNIRSRWVEQGSWGNEWGPAWPKDSHPMTTKWEHQGGGPFFGPYNPTTSESRPGARWGHEESDPEPESEPESEPKSESEQERRPIFGIFGLGVGQPKRPRPRRRPIKYIQTPLGPLPQYPIPRPTVHNPEASRPYHQFLYQISKERDWIKDEMGYKAPGSVIDLNAMAYQGVKNNWIKDGVWNPKWDELPGRRGSTKNPRKKRWWKLLPLLMTPAHGPRHPSIFGPAPNPEVTNERRPSGRTREALSRQLAVTHGTQDPEQAPRRSLRSARSSQADEALPLQLTQRRLNRSRGDDLDEQTSKSQSLNIGEDLSPSERSVPSPPRQSKRSRCSVAVEDEQPPKRPRYSTRHSVLSSRNSSDTADTNKESHNSKTVVTKGTTLPCDEKAASTSTAAGRKRLRAASNPLRRSTRIAEREREQAAEVAAELQGGRSRAVQMKTTKRGRPRRGDQYDISTPKRDRRRVPHIVRAKAKWNQSREYPRDAG